jgi:hypothetical protein
MKKTIWLATGALALGMIGQASASSLVVGDFLNTGDHLLVTDTSTGLEWLKPLYTAGDAYDNAFVQSLISSDGFRYATEAEVVSMLNNNFNNPPVGSPGTVAGLQDVLNFFNIFGINQQETCGGPPTPCPRTQGLTSTATTFGGSPAHVGVGMIEFQGNGFMLDPNPWPDSLSGDLQMGSWLVRADSPVPEPGPMLSSAIGLALLVIGWKRRRLL